MVPAWLPYLSAVIGGLIALLIGSRGMAVGRRLGLLDFPDRDGGRKRHEQVTPLVGGVAVLVALSVVTLVTLTLADIGMPALRHLGWLLAATLVIGGIGMVDDRLQLSATSRLSIAVVGLAVMVLSAPDFRLDFIRFTGQDRLILLGSAGTLFSLLCLVGLLNAINMADGKNGLVIGLSIIWTVLLLLRAPAYLQPVLTALLAALAVLFCFNMAGRLFLGDAGSYALSTMLGLSAIYVYNHDFAEWRADGVALLFAIPVFDTIRLMTVRLARRHSPFKPDRDHLHHHLAYGWGWPQGLVIYLGLVLVPNLLAIVAPEATLWLLLASLVTYVAALWIADHKHPVDLHARDFRP